MRRWKWTSVKRSRTERVELELMMNRRANDTHENNTRTARDEPCQIMQVGLPKYHKTYAKAFKSGAELALTVRRMQTLQDSFTVRSKPH